MQPAPRLGPFDQEPQAVADQVRRRLVAGVEDEDAVLQQLVSDSRSPLASPWMSRVRRSLSGSPGRRRRSRDQASRDRRGSRRRRGCRRSSRSADGNGSSAPRIASDQPRSGPRSPRGTSSRLPMISTGIAAAKSSMRSISRLSLGARRAARRRGARAPSSMPAMARGVEGAGDQAPDARVQRRVVEDEARRVMLVERARRRISAPNSTVLSELKTFGSL